MVTVGGLTMTLINLRNARLWLLRISGRRASGAVENVEIATDPNGEVLRRPRVSFMTAEGRRMLVVPALFRVTTDLTNGTAVNVSYSRRNPDRVAVHGFDFRFREAVYAVLGLVVAASATALYFTL